jgi:glutamyl-tRNA reductase
LYNLEKNILLIGVNHKTAPIEVRERLSFEAATISKYCLDLTSVVGAQGALILSTCNRTEVYVCSEDPSLIINWLAEVKSVPKEFLTSHVYIKENLDVLTHAVQVASGMNSMVLGETQIFGQIKLAYQHSDSVNCLGGGLRNIFETAFSIAKRVRSNTDIGTQSVSTASVAMRMIERIFQKLSHQSVLFMGAGEMIRLFSQHFSSRKFKRLTFSNRTRERADALASIYGGDAINLSNVPDALAQFDVVISCTSSEIPILGKGAFENALKNRRHKPIAIMDLAVPRDIETSVSQLDDIFLFTIDDLGALVQAGIDIRQAAIDEANQIIESGVRSFSSQTYSPNAVDRIRAFRDLGAHFVEVEFQKSVEALKRNEDPEKILRRMSNAIGQKFLDRPSRAVRNADGEQKKGLSDALGRLFDLDDPA